MIKSLLYITIVATLMTLFSCKKVRNETMTVVIDCTGTYLQFDGKDYHVCNLEKTEAFPNGTKVKATFKKIKQCTGSASNSVVCYMLHENEGWVNVEKIK